MVPGPPLTPADELLEWLESQGKKTLRLPVVVHFSEGRLGIARAYVAVSPGREKGALKVGLDDTALGISLLDRLRDRCAPSVDFCAVWLDGTWGRLIEAPVEDDQPIFTVRHLHGPVKSVPAKPTVFYED